MKACLTTEDISAGASGPSAREGDGVIGMDYVKEVTTPAAYQWDPDDQISAVWRSRAEAADEAIQSAAVRHRIVAYDFGIKENILRRLRQDGFR